VFTTNIALLKVFPTSVGDYFMFLVVLAKDSIVISLSHTTFNSAENPIGAGVMTQVVKHLPRKPYWLYQYIQNPTPSSHLVQDAITSSLDYQNSLLIGHAAFILVPLQSIFNNASRVTCFKIEMTSCYTLLKTL
jgi:hypothetical protein